MADKYKMNAGQRYIIAMDDCCIQAKITGVFHMYEDHPDEYDEDDSELEFADARFDFGVIGPMWGAWDVLTVEEEMEERNANVIDLDEVRKSKEES